MAPLPSSSSEPIPIHIPVSNAVGLSGHEDYMDTDYTEQSGKQSSFPAASFDIPSAPVEPDPSLRSSDSSAMDLSPLEGSATCISLFC